MYNNGQCYLWIPSILSLSTLSDEAVAIINAVHSQFGKPLVTTASMNPYIMALNDLDMGGAPFTRDAEPGMACCGPIVNQAYLTPDYAALIVAFGGEIEALKVFFEIDDLTDEVPASFPNRTYTSGPIGNQVTSVHTWETWGVVGESHKPQQLGSKWYRSVDYGQSGTPLNASHWVGAGLTVLTKTEYDAVVAEHASVLP